MSVASALRAPLAPGLRGFVQGLSDAVLVLDARLASVLLANAACERLLGAAALALPAPLERVLGSDAAQALRAASSPRGEADLGLACADGRRLDAALHRLDAAHWLLRVRSGAGEGAAQRELIGMFWDSPFPASLQDASFRLVAVNEAFVQFTGYQREQLLGADLLALAPEADHAFEVELRERWRESGAASPLVERRLIDAEGRARWFRAALRVLRDAQGRPLYLTVLQDSGAEHAAREQADRSERDLEQWFDMSPLGMVLYDGAGLLVRSNPAFEALVGGAPVVLAEASAGVRQLLAWERDGPSSLLHPGAAPLAREVYASRGDGGVARRLRALVRGYDTPSGQRRYMAMVEDLSAEEERDLAQLQIGALMDTAGVGVATFQDAGAALDEPAPASPPAPTARSALQSISRELVAPETLPEYERVQQALRQGQRVEARYAIRHPELGARWLLTRVEPGQLASGKRTTSVITLDVTDQELVRSRNEQLAQELASVLDSSPAGIVHLRGDVLLRCNRRFERMLGLASGSAAGRSARELFAGLPAAQRLVDGVLDALARESVHQSEFRVPRPEGAAEQWVALSARSFRSATGATDVIAVLSDITRLKQQQAELERVAHDRELMFSLSEVGIAFLRDGRIQRANPALEQLTQFDAATLHGLDIRQLFAERAEFHRIWALEDAALRQHGRWSGERRLKRADGSLVWVQVSKRLVHADDPGGGIIASYVNVDARRRAEATLVQQAETTRAVLDSVLVGIVTVGPGGIEWMNRSARRMCGGSLQEFVGLPIATVATEEAEHPFRRTWWLDELAEGEAETFECRVQARDGRRFWVAGNAVATRAPGGGRQLTWALLDIERRRAAEQRTAEAQASLRRITEMAPLAISLYDAASLELRQINPAALALLGARDASSVLDRPLRTTHPAGLAAPLEADLRAALASGEASKREYRIEASDGTSQLWEARLMPLAAPLSAPDQILCVASDVTEQRAAQEARFEAALAQRDLLVKEVHHRIKNNLQGVAGLMQQIAQRRPEVAGVIAEVVGQVQAIAQVYGLQVGASGPLALARLVEAIAASVERSFGRPIAVRSEGEVGWVLPEAESIPIALTLNELLVNAVKHGAAAGKLACSVREREDGALIEIANRGALPSGFDLAAVRGGVSGLGLVRALLPRKHARLALEAHDGGVRASVELLPPVVTRLTSA
jgi:PAS domain S-box-containing protein